MTDFTTADEPTVAQLKDGYEVPVGKAGADPGGASLANVVEAGICAMSDAQKARVLIELGVVSTP